MDQRELLAQAGSDLLNSSNVLVEGLSDLLHAQAVNLLHMIDHADKNTVYTKTDLIENNERITTMLTSIATLEETISQKLSIGEDLLRNFNIEFNR